MPRRPGITGSQTGVLAVSLLRPSRIQPFGKLKSSEECAPFLARLATRDAATPTRNLRQAVERVLKTGESPCEGLRLKVTYVSSTSPRATAPAGSVGSVNVTVTTPSGSSNGNLSYTYDLVPTVTSVSPDSGPVAGGTMVTVDGSGFALGYTTVEIGQSTPALLVRSM
jgi:IPT/TIG domain